MIGQVRTGIGIKDGEANRKNAAKGPGNKVISLY